MTPEWAACFYWIRRTKNISISYIYSVFLWKTRCTAEKRGWYSILTESYRRTKSFSNLTGREITRLWGKANLNFQRVARNWANPRKRYSASWKSDQLHVLEERRSPFQLWQAFSFLWQLWNSWANNDDYDSRALYVDEDNSSAWNLPKGFGISLRFGISTKHIRNLSIFERHVPGRKWHMSYAEFALMFVSITMNEDSIARLHGWPTRSQTAGDDYLLTILLIAYF